MLKMRVPRPAVENKMRAEGLDPSVLDSAGAFANEGNITANGNVLPCCISVFTDTPYEELVLGNVFETPVSEVWNGPRYRAWRGAMLSGEPPKACRGCGVAWSL